MPEQVGTHFVLVGGNTRSGGLSTIRKGVDVRDGTDVAVKFVVGSSDELSQKVFERETRALRSLSHPNIVRFRDAGIDETGTYYVVLDWVERNLTDLLRDPTWQGWGDLYTSIAKPLIDGLAYAHLKQLEHRDIKPGNILIDTSGAPLLADFGIAKLRAEETHSEYTVQHFRSGPYAPPELHASVPYVRDVYSTGVVLLQCLSDAPIRDFPDIRPALDSVRVPPDIRRLLEACVNPEPTERPANASVLADEFSKLVRRNIAIQQQPRNPIWLEFTNAALKHLDGSPPNRERAAAKLQADLTGELFAKFAVDRETGRSDRSRIVLIGQEHRYTLIRPEEQSPRLLITAAPALEFEALEGLRRDGLALPPVFSWATRPPANLLSADRARQKLMHLLDEFESGNDALDHESPELEGEELFDRWLRILEAREDLARGEHQPLTYKKVRIVGRKNTFTLAEINESDLMGTDWQAVDQQSGRRFGHGEVIDQDADQLTLLSSRPLASLPPTASLVPYDAPSAIALGRQRNAVLAIKSGTTAGPDLPALLIDPSSNAQPVTVEVGAWSENIDPIKRRAVQLALGAPNLLVIQGPPGTGKTRFITETVTQLLKKRPRLRVLIASQTHVAVDHAVERLHTAGVGRMVRLAGTDESVVQPAVRELLLDKQIRRWADGVRLRAEDHIAQQSRELGVDASHLRAVVALEQLVAVSKELEAVERHLIELPPLESTPSDLITAIEEENPAEELQARLDHLCDRREELAREAQTHLAGDLTIPTTIGSSEARNAIEVLIANNSGAEQLIKWLQLQALWLERINAADSLAAIFLAGTSVVAGTCTGFLRNKAVGQLEFDVCIIDEASKATVTEALVPMVRSKRWILLGDTRQLPPSDEDLLRNTELLDEYGLSREDVRSTLFQRLVDLLPDHSQLLLEQQYRMVRPIGDLISTCFYEGQLRSPNTDALHGYETVVGRTVTWIDTSALGDRRREKGIKSYANRAEAQLVVSQLETIDGAIDRGLIKPRNDKTQLEVLVIAPYKSQVEELRRRLAPKSFRHLATDVLSVDAVQGRESDLALFSVTRSNPYGKLGFLGVDYWRRINVALSRARFGLTIVGDADFIRGTHGALKTVLEYIERHPGDCIIRRENDG